MKIINTSIDGVFKIQYDKFNDKRGISVKTFCAEWMSCFNIKFEMEELFYSISNKNVIRGMHYQNKPFQQEKIINVVKGEILDVILDLRPESKTFKKYEEFRLKDSDNTSLFVPKGCAHGFRSLEDDTIVFYAISGKYSKDHDTGIRWDSFGYDWGVEKPILGERDEKLPSL